MRLSWQRWQIDKSSVDMALLADGAMQRLGSRREAPAPAPSTGRRRWKTCEAKNWVVKMVSYVVNSYDLNVFYVFDMYLISIDFPVYLAWFPCISVFRMDIFGESLVLSEFARFKSRIHKWLKIPRPAQLCWAVIQPPWWTKLLWLYPSWRWSLWEVWQTSLPTKSKMSEILLILHTSSKSHGSWNCWCLLGWLCPSHFIGLFRVSQSLRWQMAHRASPCYQKRRGVIESWRSHVNCCDNSECIHSKSFLHLHTNSSPVFWILLICFVNCEVGKMMEVVKRKPRWWFQVCFIFIPTWGRFPSG